MEKSQENPTCAVTQHLVDEVAQSNPEFFMENGLQNDLRVLAWLGFHVKPKLRHRKEIYEKDEGVKVHTGHEIYNVECQYNALIRSNQFPTKAYRTRIYKGFLRKAALPEGGFHKTYWHKNRDLYDQFSVLQPDDLSKHISLDELIEVQSILKGRG